MALFARTGFALVPPLALLGARAAAAGLRVVPYAHLPFSHVLRALLVSLGLELAPLLRVADLDAAML